MVKVMRPLVRVQHRLMGERARKLVAPELLFLSGGFQFFFPLFFWFMWVMYRLKL